jgi:uncharacterized protein YigE (DUF2233 family)
MSKQTIVYSCLKQLSPFFWGLLGLCLLLVAPPSQATRWQTLAPGIEYIDAVNHPLTRWSHVHVFRINLKQNQLDVVMATSLSKTNASADQFAHYSNAMLSINGGFFDRNFHSLGLRVSEHQQLNPVKHISWWSIFYIKAGKAHVSGLRQYKKETPVDFAVQSGPRLLVKGQIVPLLKPGFAERSALGIDAEGQVMIIVTESSPMTTTDLALLIQASPLNCIDALNLDGGSSSQLYAHFGTFRINDPGFSNVSDGIAVKPRET